MLTNVLSDWLLAFALDRYGAVLAGKLVAAAAVLIFFWGSFGTLAALSRRRPYFLLPWIALLAYGWVFHMGFLNFYLSVGLSLLALALGWSREFPGPWKLRLAGSGALLLLGTVANPIGPLWAIGMLTYRFAWERWANHRVALAAFSVIAVIVLRIALEIRYQAIWNRNQLHLISGADQVLVFGVEYRIVFVLVLAISAWIVFTPRSFSNSFAKHAYVISACAVGILPEALILSPDGAEHIAYLAGRLSLFAAFLGVAVLAAYEPSRAMTTAIAGVAVLGFLFIYKDSSRLNRLEAEAESIIRQLPQGARVVTPLAWEGYSRNPWLSHTIERACIGHCFSFDNYEAASRVFRVRAKPGNTLVRWTSAIPPSVQYFSTGSQAPLFQIAWCRQDAYRLCFERLQPE
ncbi:MAG: hypothetical protein AB7O65_02270 [Candidatus Korobacteraceae bacterium]